MMNHGLAGVSLDHKYTSASDYVALRGNVTQDQALRLRVPEPTGRPGRYNQIANFVLAQSEINIAIGDKAPGQYCEELTAQCAGGPQKYGGITNPDDVRANLRMNCLQETLLEGRARSRLMRNSLRFVAG